MSKEEPYRDHAEKLKQRIDKADLANDDDFHPLPPRSAVHRSKKKRTKRKLKYPLIRLLTLFFILLPVVIFSVYTYLENKHFSGAEKVAIPAKGYETVNIAKPQTGTQSASDTGKQKDKTKLGQDRVQGDQDSQAGDADKRDVQKNSVSNSSAKNSHAADTSTDGADGTNQFDETKMIYHTVQPGETLYQIAIKFYHSKQGMETIIVANNLPDNQIRAGQVLKIPLTE